MSAPFRDDDLEPAPSFIFSDPAGKRWPRLRLLLLIAGVALFLGTVLFVQTLFVAPHLELPFTLRQLKGQLKALQKANPAAQQAPATALLWQKFAAARRAAKNPSGTPAPAPAHPRRKSANAEVRLAFYTNGDPYSYTSFEQHASQLTHICPEWMVVTNGSGDLQVDPDNRVPKLAAAKGVAVMPLLTNLVGETWQPEAVENLAHGSVEQQDRFIRSVLTVLNDARAAGVVVEWEQLDPAYKGDITAFLDRFTDALHYDDKQLWLCVQPGQDLDYIDFEELSDNVDRFVALLFDETSNTDTPGPIASRQWFEGWLRLLLDGAERKQWIIALGGYGYDWTGGAKKAEMISFAEAMSRASYAEVPSAAVNPPDYNPFFYYQDADKDHAVWFLDVATFINEVREVRDGKAGGFALYRLGTEDPAIWDALNAPADFTTDPNARSLLEVLRGTDTITDVGEGEIVSVDQNRADGASSLAREGDGSVTATYSKFPQFPTLYHQGAGAPHQVALTFDDGPDPEWTPEILDILKAANVKAA
ncbi:MAG: glycosyl hydrolase family 18 protein, partial [Chthoniobacterales bacterium]